MMLLFLFAGCNLHIPRDPGILVRDLHSNPPHLNPIVTGDSYSGTVSRYIYESLLNMDNTTLEMVPWIAERWEISPDGLHYTFYLRKDVRWSDGLPLTAEDVVYSYNTIMDPKVDAASLRNYYGDIQKVTAIDSHTVRFDFNRPYFLAIEFCGSMPIIPKHIFNNGMDFNTHPANMAPIGSGPFKLVKWEQGQFILLERNPNYWNKAFMPGIKGMQFLVIPDATSAFQLLKKGGLDFMQDLRPIQWMRQTESKKFEERFKKYKYYSPSLVFIGWNLKRPQFSDKRVRQAMAMLLDLKKMNEKLSFGLPQLVSGPAYYFGPAYDRSIEPYSYNPARARKLLKEAGWKEEDGYLVKDGKPFRFVLVYGSGSPGGDRIASIMREELEKVGIEMDLLPMEFSTLNKKIISKEFDAVSLAWGGGTVESDSYQLFHSSQIAEGSNFVGFDNARADQLMEAIRSELNPEKRHRMQHELHAILHEEQPYLFMSIPAHLSAVDRRFTHVKEYPMGFDLLEWGFDVVPRYME